MPISFVITDHKNGVYDKPAFVQPAHAYARIRTHTHAYARMCAFTCCPGPITPLTPRHMVPAHA